MEMETIKNSSISPRFVEMSGRLASNDNNPFLFSDPGIQTFHWGELPNPGEWRGAQCGAVRDWSCQSEVGADQAENLVALDCTLDE